MSTDPYHKKWNAFWDTFPGWLKACIFAACGVTAGIGGNVTLAPKKGDDLRMIVSQELEKKIGPLRAGFEALASEQKDGVRIKVLEAMARAERRSDRANP